MELWSKKFLTNSVSGLFVAIAYNSNNTAYSKDGVNWTATTLPNSLEWQTIAYGKGTFVAIASRSNVVAYSKNGVDWLTSTLPTSNQRC